MTTKDFHQNDFPCFMKNMLLIINSDMFTLLQKYFAKFPCSTFIIKEIGSKNSFCYLRTKTVFED